VNIYYFFFTNTFFQWLNERSKKKTISGLSWSFIESVSQYGLTFVVSIILARQLSPEDFGLIGMTTIFIAISTTLIDSGFAQALIRKQNTSNIDLSSVFYLNILLGIAFFMLLFFTSPYISSFFDEPKLINIIRVISIGLFIGSFTSIQQTILIKRLDFKLMTLISAISTFFSGVVSIIMAFKGFGVWSLIFGTLVSQSITTLLLWKWNSWRPSLVFSINAIKELFSFGSKLLITSLINTTFNNIYYLIIGKYFSAGDLGYYTRADNFQKLPSQNLTQIIQRVSFPILASIQEDVPKLKSSYIKLLRSIMFITFILMMGMAGSAKEMIVALIGEKWLPSVAYLQMLCFVGMFYPLHAINLNMLNVLGRSDLFLKLEIIKKSLVIPVVIIGIIFGIKYMILGMMVNTLIAYYLNSYWSGVKIGYGIIDQVKDILPSFMIGLLTGLLTFGLGYLLELKPIYEFLIQIASAALFVILVGESARLRDYLFLKDILTEQLNKIKNIRQK